MPVVPSYDNLQTGFRPAAPNIGGPAPGAIAGQQLQEFGRAVSGASGAAAQVALDMQREANDLRVNDALNQAVQARTDAQLGVLKLRGRDALERPDGKLLQDESAESLGQQFDALRESLGNDVQKQAFQQRAQQLMTQFRASVGEHVLREYQAHRDQVDEAGIAAARRQADLNPDDANLRQQSLETIRAIVDGAARRKGWEAPQREVALVAALSPVHLGVIGSLMRQDVDRAESYFKSVEGELDARARDNIREALAQRSAEVRAGNAVRELTAAPQWSMAEADKALVTRFGDKPEELKIARAELRYQEQLRRDTQAEQAGQLLAPVHRLVGDAINAGRMIAPRERDGVIGGMRLTNPDLYAQAAKLIDQHNDEVRNEQRAAAAHARSLVGTSMDARINAAALRFDMLFNPGKYRTMSPTALFQALEPDVRAGRLPVEALNSAGALLQDLQTPKKREEFVSLMTATQHLDARLRGSVIDGKRWDKMDPKDQQVVKARALEAAEPLLAQLQAQLGNRADDNQVKAVIDSLFVDREKRSFWLGRPLGVQRELSTEDAATRLPENFVRDAVSRIPPSQRAAIEQALRARGIEVAPDVVLQYWRAGQQGR